VAGHVRPRPRAEPRAAGVGRAHRGPSRRTPAARPGDGEAADGQPARPPAPERRGADPLRRAGRHLPGRPPRRLHGQELRRRVRDRPRDCDYLEAQDFLDEDRKLTYSCYEPEGRASAWTLDLTTGEKRNETASIGFYNEPEGLFPDGQHTCVESDHQSRAFGDPASFRNIDIWKLRLDGTGRSFTRLTTFNDHEGWKASNPVVSRDGRFMAFQVARTADEAGVGYGILLLRFEQGSTR
jgi:hypothetical protein